MRARKCTVTSTGDSSLARISSAICSAGSHVSVSRVWLVAMASLLAVEVRWSCVERVSVLDRASGPEHHRLGARAPDDLQPDREAVDEPAGHRERRPPDG